MSSGKSDRLWVAIQSHRPTSATSSIPHEIAREQRIGGGHVRLVDHDDGLPAAPRLRSASRWMVFIRPMNAMDRMSGFSSSLASLPKSTMVQSTSGQGSPGRLKSRFLARPGRTSRWRAGSACAPPRWRPRGCRNPGVCGRWRTPPGPDEIRHRGIGIAPVPGEYRGVDEAERTKVRSRLE